MDVSTRAALVQRISPYLSDGAVVPQSWEELPLTTRLVIETNDAEAAAVFRGSMGADLEAQVLAGIRENPALHHLRSHQPIPAMRALLRRASSIRARRAWCSASSCS